METSKFISAIIITDTDKQMLKFINTAHIIQVYEENDNVYLELTDNTIYKVATQNIHIFMDRFV
jgi:hypothetical protein